MEGHEIRHLVATDVCVERGKSGVLFSGSVLARDTKNKTRNLETLRERRKNLRKRRNSFICKAGLGLIRLRWLFPGTGWFRLKRDRVYRPRLIEALLTAGPASSP